MIDYENFEVSATKDYNLSVTDQGLQKLLETVKRHGNVANKDVMVAAYWDHFRKGKDFFRKKFSSIIDVPVLGPSVTDGYLIIEGLLHFQQLSEIDNVVLVSGDGVNTALVEAFLKNKCKVHVYAWEKCYSSCLKVNEDVSLYLLDDVFQFATSGHITNKWFTPFGVTPPEYAIICRVLNSRYNDLYFSKTAREIAETTDERYAEFDTPEKAKAFLGECKDKGIFTSHKKLGSQGRDEITVFELNYANEKVKHVQEKEKSAKKAAKGISNS
ncbi:NYN domain-containing protein [Ectobacillus funiculus]|uniref:NYN domain-containing protein n=1 Tax=Ectobacillus funiculus TaxID=137993 RepID=A0ABV5WES1_9BACI